MNRIVVWFRNDLRLSDNEVLWHACQEADEIIPFYCFDDRFYGQFPWGLPKTGSFRAQFIIESVADLHRQLAEKKVHLQIHQGNTTKALEQLKHQFDFDTIYCAEEVSAEELELEQAIEAAGFRLKRFWNYSLYAKEALPFEIEQMPDVFTPFRKKMEKYAEIEAALPIPNTIKTPKELGPCTLPSLEDLGLEKVARDPRTVLNFKGGSEQAWQRLKDYFWENDRLKDYKKTRNGMLGEGYSSKFSPCLATGSISPREIYWEIKNYEAERVKNSSTYWLYFELMWRDFFRFTALKEGNHFFRIPKNPTYKKLPQFEAWRLGETGQDFVDANMKELLLTGFMSNRGRQNVASYLVHDLKLPWYLGATWFESQLVDYDVCSNYGNWTYVAGIGHDPRPDRYFNVVGQAERYDSDYGYRGNWL